MPQHEMKKSRDKVNCANMMALVLKHTEVSQVKN